jgi:hypothetical protein
LTNFKVYRIGTDAVNAQELASKRFQLNMARVNRLLSLGQRLRQAASQQSDALADRPDDLADLYRSTVVFLHASFEDFLGTIADIRLGHVPKRTFGNVDVVVEVLQKLGLDLASFQPLFPEISALMIRRHRIVHNGDLPAPDAVTEIPWTIGDDYQLIVWLFAVSAFASGLHVALDPTRLADEWFATERMEIIQRLTEARRIFVAAPTIQEKERALRGMVDDITEILVLLKRPKDAVVRAIADKHGIRPH